MEFLTLSTILASTMQPQPDIRFTGGTARTYSSIVRIALLIIGVSVLVHSDRGQTEDLAEAGRVHVVRRHEPSFDRFTRSPDTAQQEWMRTHFWRFAAFSTYFDSRVRWFPNAWLYVNLYGIEKDSAIVTDHPEWLLRDAGGNPMFVPWGCAGNTCPLYAADVSNVEFRRWWISGVRQKLAIGYKGIWLDDVNLMFRVGNGQGSEIPPFDRNVNGEMSYDSWRRYVAEFVEQIRSELKGYEVVHNSLWFGGPSGLRQSDTYVRRQIMSCDFVNLERGVNDDGLTGGTGEWSLSALLKFIDDVHALGRGVVLDELETQNLEYALAAYFLISTGHDAIGEFTTTPDNWYAGYDLNLGAPLTGRYVWRGLLRRDFALGIVLLNEPGAASRNVALPGSFLDVTGGRVNSITLSPKGGVVLRYDSSPTQ